MIIAAELTFFLSLFIKTIYISMLNYCIKRKSSIFIPIQHRICHKAADGLAAFGCKLRDLSRLILGAGRHYASGLAVNP